LLSQAGREVLTKAVIQAIPTYAMSCFKFPAGLCDEICSLANRFWWGQWDGGRKIHWLSKQKLAQSKSEGGMGFRDLHLFNKALLARQGWRILHQPQSLVHRVLKAKYFPHQNFLEDPIPRTASFIWRSICGSKDVLIAGLRWRVGTGDKMKIWKDPWLPCPTSHRVISPMSGSDENTTVDTLIDRDRVCWKTTELERLFMPRDVEAIQQIPLSRRRPLDLLIWTGTKNGIFTVRSAYHLLRMQQSQPTASGSSSSHPGAQIWTGIWAAHVQPKVKLSVWRACKNILPTQTNLFDRRVISTYSCQWCEEEAETSDHVLWRCEFAQRVWQQTNISFPLGYATHLTFFDLIWCSLNDLQSPAIEVLFTTAWELWNARNALLFEETVTTVNDICQKAAGAALDFLESTAQLAPIANTQIMINEVKWRPPANDNFKLNVGTHGSTDQHISGLAALIRDSQGLVTAALCSKILVRGNGLQKYAHAVLWAINFAYDIGIRRVEVDLTNKELWGMLTSCGPCMAPIGTLVEDISAWKDLFYSLSFSFIKNVCNKAANALATEALSSISDEVWLEDCPASIISLVQFDYSQ
jgi:hypothetical protein